MRRFGHEGEQPVSNKDVVQNSPTERGREGTESAAWIRYEWSEADCPSTAFVQAVADATGRDPREMPPLYEYVDTDALDELLGSSTDRPGSIGVTITYDGITGRLNSDGELILWEDVITHG